MASLTDGLGDFFAGESTLKIDVGISSDSMVKLAIMSLWQSLQAL